MLPPHRGVGQAKRPGAHGHTQVVALARCELGPLGAQIQVSCRAKVLCALEDVTLLTIVERNLVDVVEREFAQIYLAILRVAQLDAIVEHAHVVAAHRADVHRLQTAHAAIVLELHTAEVAYGVGHAVTVETLEHLAAEHLCRDDLAIRFHSIDHHLTQILHRVKAGVPHSHAVLGPQAQDGTACHPYCHKMSHSSGFLSTIWQVF